jgi:hypothetical protein|tara:strand:- start:370 stop:495 length:126 start_codon:yes stop_codon:yes gene_type:complete
VQVQLAKVTTVVAVALATHQIIKVVAAEAQEVLEEMVAQLQ